LLKESLIAEKYRLNDRVNTLRRESKAAEDEWKKDKETLEKTVNEKSSAFDEMRSARDRLQSELAQLKVYRVAPKH